MKTKKITQTAVLLALALVLSRLERMIPLELLIPLPGVKLGLANTVSMFALYAIGFRSAALITLLRAFLGFAFSGNAVSLLFSLTGGVLSLLVMIAAKRTKHFSIFGVSVLGAAAHSSGQIVIAVLLMHSRPVFSYLPYLLLVSLFTGLLTAAIAAEILKRLRSAAV